MDFKAYLVMLIIFIACIALALAIGVKIDFLNAFLGFYDVLKYHLGVKDVIPSSDALIFWEVRFPRVLLAVFVGSILSISGSAMQTSFKNPLIDPYLFGISQGAALGCAISIGFLSFMPVSLGAFIGAILASGLVLALSRRFNNDILGVVLMGVIISAFLGAITGFIKYFVSAEKAQAIVVWLLGDLNNADYFSVFIAFIGFIVSVIPLLFLRFRLNILSLSKLEVISLGVDSKKLNALVILLVSFGSAMAVSTSGTIGWIGLVVPHICRIFVGSNLSRLLPFSVFVGAIFLLLSDTLARTLLTQGIPVGIITAIIGAPIFVTLIAFKNKS